jgi:glycosyltransferase involved in cell wall biosynthesis
MESLKGNNPRGYFFKNTFKNIKSYNPKIIYIDNDPISFQTLVIGFWSKFAGIKVVCLTCENIEINLKQKIKTRSIKKIINTLTKLLLAKLTRNLVSHVFTINNSGTEIYKKLCYKSVGKIPLGFDASIFNANEEARSRIREELKVNHQTSIIAYIGRLTFEKGVHVLLKSIAMIKEYDWVLMLDEFKSTKTSYHNQIISQIKELGLQNKVIYIDAKHLEIAEYMNAADMIIIPSISTEIWVEQYGRVAPEAMACKKLIIASNTGALPELIGETGILVPENDEKKLMEAIIAVLENPDKYKEIKELALKRSENFNLEKQAQIMATVFNSYN